MEQFKENLNRIQGFLDEMNQTSSGNAKLEILKKWSNDEFLLKVFKYTYNHFKKYGVHTKVLKKNKDLIAPQNMYSDLFQLLDDLAERNITGHAAVQAVNAFTKDLTEDQTAIVHNILDRDLRMGASITSILKVVPNIVPTFKVALAHPYDPKRVDFTTERWFGSRKLDGVRCICRKEGNNISFYSRNGKEFETLGRIAEDIAKLPGNFVLDGEVCIVDNNGKEDFQGIMKEIRRKNHTIENPKFLIFDCLTLDEFDTQTGTTPLYDRSVRVPIQTVWEGNFDTLTVIDQVLIHSEEEFSEMAKDAENEGYEGIMIRKNIPYEGKRSHNLLKVKKFYDAEYKVLEAHNGIIRWIENGQQIEKECLSSIVIEHKGCRVSVGSGFSKEQREYYYENPQDLIGKTVTIQYFEESQNQMGGYSLRFPVVKHIYESGRDV